MASLTGANRSSICLRDTKARQIDNSHLADIRDALREAIEGGTPRQKNALFKTLIAEIRVDGSESAPLYLLPRRDSRAAGSTGPDPRGDGTVFELPNGK